MASTGPTANSPPIPAQLPHVEPSVDGNTAGAGNGGGDWSGSVETAAKNVPPEVMEVDNDKEVTEEASKSPHTPPNANKRSDSSVTPTPDASDPDVSDPNGNSPGGKESPSQPEEPAPTPAERVSVASLLSFTESLEYIESGVLPKSHPGPVGHQNIRPERRVAPPRRGLDGNSYLVGVPLTCSAYRSGHFVQDGYGGLESVMVFDGLTTQDVSELGYLVGDQVELREMLLRPHTGQEIPSLTELKSMLESLTLEREAASILMHFPLERLAERLFFSMSLLHRVLDHVRSRMSIRTSSGVSIRDSRLQTKYDQLLREYKQLQAFHEQEVTAVRVDMSTLRVKLDGDFVAIAKERVTVESKLNDQVKVLEAQLKMANSKIIRLEKRNNKNDFDADILMEFFNSNGSSVRVQWPRLRHLLRHFQQGTPVPDGWETWITIETPGKPYRMWPPFPGSLGSDSEASDDEARGPDGGPEIIDVDQGEKTEEDPPAPARSSGSGWTTTSPKPNRRTPSKRSRSKSLPQRMGTFVTPDGPVEVQLRPTVHQESNKKALPTTDVYSHTVDEALSWLPDIVPQEEVPLDVLYTIQDGNGYDETVEMMSRDEPARHRFASSQLVEILAEVMYSLKLDETPWTQHVPEFYYKMAEILLKDWLAKGVYPPKWFDLRNLVM